MIFIVRSASAEAPAGPGVRVVLVRRTPGSTGEYDLFCVSGEPEVVPLHDGWYADDRGGGVAVWGQGRYWEVRPTPFVVALSDLDPR